MTQDLPPFERSNPSADEGRDEPIEPIDMEANYTAHESAQDARFQLDQDLAALIDEFDHAEPYTDESTTLRTTAPLPTGPSLSIILLSAASTIAGFVIALYLSYREFAFSIEVSAAIATFFASATLGITGAALSALTDSRSATSNIAFSCGLILISLLFFGLCLLVGAVAALFLLMVAG